MSDTRSQQLEDCGKITVKVKDKTWNGIAQRKVGYVNQLEGKKPLISKKTRYELPLCLKFDVKEVLTDDELNAIVSGVLARHELLTIYLNPNPAVLNVAEDWKNAHQDLISNSHIQIKEMREWRETEAWKKADKRLDDYLASEGGVAAREKLAQDVTNRRYAKFSDVEKHLICEAKDCLSWLEPIENNPDFIETIVLLYKNNLSQFMHHVLQVTAKLGYDERRSMFLRSKVEFDVKLEQELAPQLQTMVVPVVEPILDAVDVVYDLFKRSLKDGFSPEETGRFAGAFYTAASSHTPQKKYSPPVSPPESSPTPSVNARSKTAARMVPQQKQSAHVTQGLFSQSNSPTASERNALPLTNSPITGSPPTLRIATRVTS